MFIEIPQRGTAFTIVVDDDPAPQLRTIGMKGSGVGFEGEWLELRAHAKQFHDRDLVFASIPSDMRGMTFFQGPSNPNPMAIEVRTNGKLYLIANKQQVELRTTRKSFVVYNTMDLRRPKLTKRRSFNDNRMRQTEMAAKQLKGMVSKDKNSTQIGFKRWFCPGLLMARHIHTRTQHGKHTGACKYVYTFTYTHTHGQAHAHAHAQECMLECLQQYRPQKTHPEIGRQCQPGKWMPCTPHLHLLHIND